MHVDDDTRLKHIRDAAREAIRMSEGFERSSLDENRMLELA